jgi:hypothetical protein
MQQRAQKLSRERHSTHTNTPRRNTEQTVLLQALNMAHNSTTLRGQHYPVSSPGSWQTDGNDKI